MAFDDDSLERRDAPGNGGVVVRRNRLWIKKTATIVQLDLAGRRGWVMGVLA